MFNLCGDHAQSARQPRSITAELMLNFAGFAAQTQRRMQAYQPQLQSAHYFFVCWQFTQHCIGDNRCSECCWHCVATVRKHDERGFVCPSLPGQGFFLRFEVLASRLCLHPQRNGKARGYIDLTVDRVLRQGQGCGINPVSVHTVRREVSQVG